MPATQAYKSQKITRVGDNLYRNGEGTYYARFFAHGKSYKASLGTHDRKLAERKLAEFIQKIENKEQEKPDVVFQDFADRWLETIKPDLKASSYARRLSSVNQLKPIFKNCKLRQITHEHLQDWKIARSAVSSRTFNVDRETLTIIFQYAVKSGIMGKNPINKDTLPKRKEKKAIVTPPTREQFAGTSPSQHNQCPHYRCCGR